MKQIKNYIGQAKAKAHVNEIIADYKRREAADLPLPILKPLLLEGIAGTGKTTFARECIAESMGWQFVEFPPAAGIRALNKVAMAIASIDEATQMASAIPSVIFVDECHAVAKSALNIIKQMTEGGTATFQREGYTFHRDLTQHLWVFASNERVDSAIRSRCERVRIQPLNKGEAKQVLRLWCDIEIEESAADFLSQMVKLTAREVKAMSIRLARQGVDKITLDVAREVCKTYELFPLGVTLPEVELMRRMSGEAKPLPLGVCAKLLGKQGGGAEKDAREDSLDYLALFDFVEPISATRYALTKTGSSYLGKVAKARA